MMKYSIRDIYEIIIIMNDCMKMKDIKEFNNKYKEFNDIIKVLIVECKSKDTINMIDYCRYILSSICSDVNSDIYNINYMNNVIMTLEKYMQL